MRASHGVRILVVCLAVALAGCAGHESRALLTATVAAADEIAGRHDILVATTRAKTSEKAEVFGGARGQGLTFARVEVTVPSVHESGRIERPRSGATDPARHFSAAQVALYPEAGAFDADLARRLTASGGRALVFIHGYRTRFDAAVYRAAQIVHDSGYTGTPVLFSWASAGRTVDYIYDNNSATIARDALERTLRTIAASGATRIDIVAHSMGNWVLMEALRQLAITGDESLHGKLADVVLASPDIDLDVFKSQLLRIGKPEQPFFVMVSADDRALRLSSVIAGNRPRLGDYTKAEDLAQLGVIVVDLTAISAGDSLNHAKFADNPILVRLLGERLRDGTTLDGSNGIAERIELLARGVGTTVTSAAEIVITTPIEVISVAVGN